MVQTKQNRQQDKFVLISYDDSNKPNIIHKALGIYNNEEAAYAAAIVSQMQSIETAVVARKKPLKAYLSEKHTAIHELCRSMKEDFRFYKDRFDYLTEQCHLLFYSMDNEQQSSSLYQIRHKVLPIVHNASTVAASTPMNESIFKTKVRNFQDSFRVDEDVEEDLENSDGEEDEDDEDEDEEEEDEEEEEVLEEAEEEGDEEDDNIEQEDNDGEIYEDSENEDQQPNNTETEGNAEDEGDEAANNSVDDEEQTDEEDLLDAEDSILENSRNVLINGQDEDRRKSPKRKLRNDDDDNDEEDEEEVDEIDEDNEEEEFELAEDEDDQPQTSKKRRLSTVI